MIEIILPAEYLTETSLVQLYSNTTKNFDTPREQTSGRVQVVDRVIIPAPRSNLVRVKATTRSSAKNYDTRMAFPGVEYLDSEDNAQGYSFQAPDEQTYTIVPIRFNANDVRVSCSCLDFYYRFSVWNHGDGSLLGNAPPPYVKKTDQEPANPNEVPGLCKHLIALTKDLRQDKFLT